MSSKIDAKNCIEKASFRGGASPKYDPWLVPGEGGKGEVRGGRFGRNCRKEERKKVNNKVMRKGR